MKLTNPTDDQLNAAFAEKVAGWTHIGLIALVGQVCLDRWTSPDGEPAGRDEIPRFTESADTVLPWLKKMRYPAIGRVANGDWKVKFYLNVDSGGEEKIVYGIDKYFAKAAVIALLRAHGVEVEFV